jgi:hypothetical protein
LEDCGPISKDQSSGSLLAALIDMQAANKANTGD